MNKNGSVGAVIIVWVIVLAGMFVVTSLYMAMTESIDVIDDLFGDYISGTHAETYARLISDWDEWPIWCNLFFLIFGIVATLMLSREPDVRY